MSEMEVNFWFEGIGNGLVISWSMDCVLSLGIRFFAISKLSGLRSISVTSVSLLNPALARKKPVPTPTSRWEVVFLVCLRKKGRRMLEVEQSHIQVQVMRRTQMS